jgi:hypothetical protein
MKRLAIAPSILAADFGRLAEEGACKLLREAKIAKPTGSKLVKGPAESEKFVRWKSMK